MRVVSALLLVVALSLPGCGDKRRIREWRPSDHDQPEDEGQVEVPEAEQDRQPSRSRAEAADGEPDPADPTEILWRQQCIRCHGRDGSGRTSMAQRIPVADLRESQLTEAEIVQVVTKGRREMPSFAEEIDADGIRALAKKVLSLRP